MKAADPYLEVLPCCCFNVNPISNRVKLFLRCIQVDAFYSGAPTTLYFVFFAVSYNVLESVSPRVSYHHFKYQVISLRAGNAFVRLAGAEKSGWPW